MGLVKDARAEQFRQSEELITSLYLAKISLGKVVGYKGDIIWELSIGDPYVDISDLLAEFSIPPPDKFRIAVDQIVRMMRNQGTQITSAITSKVQTKVKCPANSRHGTSDIPSAVIHLNDQHMWTREQIADWLDTLDEQPVFYPSEEIRTFNTTNMVTCKPLVSKEATN